MSVFVIGFPCDQSVADTGGLPLDLTNFSDTLAHGRTATMITRLRRCFLAVVVLVLATPLRAMAQESARGVLVGMVYDSIEGRPLRGAIVQVVGAVDAVTGLRFTAVTDSLGGFSIRDVPAGSFVAGFHHARLDSLGLESEPTSVTVTGQSVRLDLATPSPATFVSLVCPDQPAAGLLVGHVRASGTGAPLANGAVAATWSEIDTTSIVIMPRNRERSIAASPSGWFALCGLPLETSVLVRAAAGSDTSGYVRVDLASNPVRVATFHVGGATQLASATAGVGPTWRGTARIAGIVRDARGEPMPNAQLSVWGTVAETSTDARGRFQLGDLPGGTQSLEVRAIGYRPVVQTVQLDAAQSLTEEIVLQDRVTELEGVTVRANATRARLAPFYERMKDSERGINRGHFITLEDLERRRPPLITNILEGIPSVRIQREGLDPKIVTVRGVNNCRMTVFLDGVRIQGTIHGEDETLINQMVHPTTVAAIEVYSSPVSAPPQYQSLNGTCGVVLIWTK